MFYHELLKYAIELGVQAAKEDYTKPSQIRQLKGSLAGFKACEKDFIQVKYYVTIRMVSIFRNLMKLIFRRK